ncbi:MAG: LacI family DNA-binding transcriptional regulator, partial [Propionibacteriaceae bacterium]|nr:LacI family DNA-binding transcriptional regulator [Propionibacteriaceae bacterium]
MTAIDTAEPPRKRRQRRRSTGVTVVDVAREAGVSTATVSRVLNGIQTVDTDLAARVQDAVLKTG